MLFNSLRFLISFVLLSFPRFAVGDTTLPTGGVICERGAFPEVYISGGVTEIISPPLLDSSTAARRKAVTVSEFCISQNEISAGIFQACVQDGYCSPLRGSQGNPDYPVHSITYDEVNQFLLWLQKSKNIEYRLPTEAEWQFAALGGREDRFPWRVVGRLPNVNIFSGEIDPVGKNSMNEFGVRDAVGNLSEFVSGCFTPDIDRIPENGLPFEAENCGYRLTKGGHYASPDFFLSPYFRAPIPADFGSPQIGLRLVRSINSENWND